MSAALGPGPVLVDVDGLPEGWEAFATNDGEKYFCFPQVYYYCRSLNKVQWDRPAFEEAREPIEGEYINGKKPWERGDELVPDPPPFRPYDGPYADHNYVASCENPEDVFQPDEDMLQACLDCDYDKLKAALEEGADVSLPNYPWQNTPLHLALSPPFWDADTLGTERSKRRELVEYLVRQGADLDVENVFHCRPIDLAYFHNYQEIAKYLEEQGAKKGWFGAAYVGDLERIQELLQEGIDIDIQGRYKRTAFAEAHLRGQWLVESFLVQQGCSRELPHPEHLKFNPGGAALPRGNFAPKREKQYHRDDDPEWYDDMMEKRYPGYLRKLAAVPKN